MTDKVKEFPIKRDLTIIEAAASSERRGAKSGIIIYFDENDMEGFCSFGDIKNKDILWLLELQKLMTMKVLDFKEI